jgi:hypothetical protein
MYLTEFQIERLSMLTETLESDWTNRDQTLGRRFIGERGASSVAPREGF